MRAFAYKESYRGGGSSYVLRHSLYDALFRRTGAETSHIEREKFEELVEELRSKGVRVITHRLPFHLRSVDTLVAEDYPTDSPTWVVRYRTPLDKAA